MLPVMAILTVCSMHMSMGVLEFGKLLDVPLCMVMWAVVCTIVRMIGVL